MTARRRSVPAVGALGLALSLALSVSAGCARIPRHRYDDVLATLSHAGRGRVAVATHDQRPYVLLGRRGPWFVGLQRDNFGNGEDVRTASGKPLAFDMTRALARTLDLNGYQSLVVHVAAADSAESVVAKVRATGAERAVIFTLREWKSDTYMNTALIYDASLRVLDGAGNVVAERALKGHDDLGGDPAEVSTTSHAARAVPVAFKQKIEQLLNDDKVSAALP